MSRRHTVLLVAIALSTALTSPAFAYRQRSGSDSVGNKCWRNCIVRNDLPYCGPRYCDALTTVAPSGQSHATIGRTKPPRHPAGQ